MITIVQSQVMMMVPMMVPHDAVFREGCLFGGTSGGGLALSAVAGVILFEERRILRGRN
jgi:hypothetical protein